uniref:Myosin XVB n=1 Tax=Oryctolagus cuniculus TaxID=9986 RepID=A0A5F9C3V6_RABIT
EWPATDHTFLQKCHYHHSSHPGYAKPQLPLPVFTVRHHAGSVTYQVHKFLHRNRDHLDPAVRDVLARSQLQLVGSLFQEAEPQAEGGAGKPTLASRFRQSLGTLLAELGRSHIYVVQCLDPNPGKIPGLFDVCHVAEQLRQAAILEAVGTRSAHFPVRVPFQSNLSLAIHVADSGALGTWGQEEAPDRERCGTILSQVLGAESPLCHLGTTQVLLQEEGWQLLQRLRTQRRSQALHALRRRLRACVSRQRLRLLLRTQACVRGLQARKRYLRRRAALGRLHSLLLLARPLLRRRRRQRLQVQGCRMGRGTGRGSQGRGQAAWAGHLAGLAGSITECLPPEVPARPRLALPPDIDQFPFSSFIATSFQEPSLPSPGQPLARPLTRLDAENSEPALDINRVMLRLLGDGSLPPWQEQAMGLYLVRQGQRCPGLRDELFSQLVAQLWHNPDEQQSQRGWALMAVLLSAFPPTPALQKPLLKFVSDQAPQGMAALCQHKLLGALEQTPLAPGAARAHPPTQLEWTAGWRRGRMALDVFTFSEESYSAEVESWTTGEQLAGWILQNRGLEAPPRGWSVSLHSGDTWQDLAGCDIVLDLIGQTEDLGDPAQPQGYPITPLGLAEDIPPAPGVQAPTLPPGLPPGPAPTLPGTGHAGEADLGTLGLDLEQGWALSGRMKGGGGIGTPQQAYPFVYPGVVQMPGYQPAMIPAPLSMMPAMGTVPTMPGMTGLGAPAPFSGGRALPGAQQMTTQAMSLSLEQQAQQRQRQAQASRDAAQDPPPAVTPKPKKPPTPRVEPKRDPEPMGASLRDEDSEDSPDGPLYPKSFQQKRDYFQKMGQEQIRVKTMKPPAKIRIPQQEEEEEEGEEEKGEDVGAVPAPPPPPGGKEPLQRGRDKAANEAEPEPEEKAGPKAGPAQGRRPTVRNLNGTSQRPEPSREIRNIIRMYQSRPGPVPVPVQPSRTPKAFWKKNDPKDEALAKLGINGTHSPPSTLSPSLGKAPPPAVAPRPKDAPRPGPSSSIREKQEPLRDLFSHTLPAAQALPPPPAPPLPPPVDPGTPAAEPHGEDPGPMRDQGFSTRLLVPSGSVCFSYASAPWRLFLRKEVFYPREAFSHPYGLKLLCEQILRDTFAESCTRISQEERSKMKDLLGHLEVGLDSLSTAEDSVRKRIVVAARDNWANYFSRIFPVSGGNGSDVQLLGVSHRGLRLLKVTQGPSFRLDQLKTLCSYSFAEVLGVECRGGSSLELSLKSEQLVLRSARAKAIKAMVELFLSELKKASLQPCSASTAGDLIKLLPVATLEPGYPRGAAGRSGLFPADLVQPAAAPDFSFSEQGSSRWRKSQLPLGEPGLAQWSRVSEVRGDRLWRPGAVHQGKGQRGRVWRPRLPCPPRAQTLSPASLAAGAHPGVTHQL